ncbi:MAG TPA: metalloregulator ArsR/SmtB family transcription factor [Actinoallomurus sp.]|nr:metalloregulator ArsR/SmtB family transcription factor [Actinoallomurus sp.]
MSVDEAALDRAFTALADPVRRALIARLSRGEATVNELAEPFPITKQAVSRHIQVLEAAGYASPRRRATSSTPSPRTSGSSRPSSTTGLRTS